MQTYPARLLTLEEVISKNLAFLYCSPRIEAIFSTIRDAHTTPTAKTFYCTPCRTAWILSKYIFFSLTKKTCSATFKPRTGFTLYHFTCKKKETGRKKFFFFFLSLGNVTSLSASEVSTFPLLEMESCFSQLEAGIPFPLCFGSPH